MNIVVAIAPPPPSGEINTLPPWILWITIAVGLAAIAVIALVYRYKRRY